MSRLELKVTVQTFLMDYCRGASECAPVSPSPKLGAILKFLLTLLYKSVVVSSQTCSNQKIFITLLTYNTQVSVNEAAFMGRLWILIKM